MSSRAVEAALVLASASPRRLDLLRRCGIEPAQVIATDVDETVRPRELPRAYASRVARVSAADLTSTVLAPARR